VALPDVGHGIDLVLVPGLGFSSAGARLGSGQGYYDRALAPPAAGAGPVLVGVCLSPWLDPAEGEIPCEPHDVRMHYVASERGVVPCRAR
jgi:5-formyltetrahydrofolate cyclo-ligase